MSNTTYGPYVPDTIVNGSTPINKTLGDHWGTQASVAINSHDGDLSSGPYVLSGMVATMNGGNHKQLDVTSGIAYLRMSDNTLAKIATSASATSQFLTVTPSTTYFLDLNPDGTWSFATSHSAVTNHVTICSLTTDGSGNINVITDTRHTVGSPPHALLVAKTIDQAISGTGAVNALAYAVPINGLYRVNASFYIGRAGTSVITFAVQANAMDNAAIIPSYQLLLQSGTQLNSANVAGAGQWHCQSAIIGAASGHNIDIHYTDATATVADFVTISIERVS